MTLSITSTSGFTQTVTSVASTAAEVDVACDLSYAAQAITVAGAITADGSVKRVTLDGASGTYAVTLAAPGSPGIMLCLEYIAGSTNAITLALTNVTGGSAATSASFNAAGESLLLYSNSTKWMVLCEGGGVTLA